jgi:ABC-2 type transport system permease protein
MLRRLLALIVKELQMVLGNQQARILLIIPVVLQTLVFPFAATLEVKNATLAVWNEDAGQASREVVQRLSRAAAFSRIVEVSGTREFQRVVDTQEALVAVRFPADFSRKLALKETAQAQIVLDGRKSNSGQIAAGYIGQVIDAYALERGGREPSVLLPRHIYNPNLDFKWHVLPSLVAIITTVGCLVVTALSVAREREEGTFDQLLVSPLTPAYIMAGKMVPGILVAVAQGTFIALTAILAYGVPFTGSVPVLFLGMVCYGLSLAGVGLCISSLSMTQQQAFFGVFSFMTPAVILSGYVSPVENMPLLLQWVAAANPLTHFIWILKGVFLKGFGLMDVLPHLWPLVAIAFCTLSVALAMFRRHIA